MNLFELFHSALPQISVLAEEPLARHTSFRVGGPAELFVQPKTGKELQAVVRLCGELGG